MAAETTHSRQRHIRADGGSHESAIRSVSASQQEGITGSAAGRYGARGAFCPTNTPLLSIQGLSHVFMRRQGVFSQAPFYALNNISLTLTAGKTLGLVGESGCGKSTLARVAAGLMPPTEGVVRIQGEPLYNAHSHQDYAAFRKDVCRTVQMVFQDPQASLNPRMRVGDSVAEPLVCLETGLSSARRQQRVDETLLQVGIEPGQASRYPHEFSGGQRQRVAIARALAVRPKLVICDEPTSSLDSSVQAQVLNLLAEMQDTLGLAYLFISHDLAVVRHMSDVVAVMYAGTIVECGPVEEVFGNPRHPYTQLLFSSAMDSRPAAKKTRHPHALGTGPGEACENTPQATAQNASAFTDDTGCPFSGRCPMAEHYCHKTFPAIGALPGLGAGEHLVRCPVVFHRLSHNPLEGGTEHQMPARTQKDLL